jgi:hypothetical protein
MAGTLPLGYWPQVWIAASSFTLDGLGRALDLYAQLQLPGVALHGGPRSLTKHWRDYAARVTGRGLACLAAFGLDGHDDDDGTVLTAAEKGEAMAAIANRPDCAGVVQDEESGYDTGVPSAWNDARTMLAAFRRDAPQALAIQQGWPEPLEHPHYPVEDLLRPADAAAPMVYPNVAWYVTHWGRARYARVVKRYEDQWSELERTRLAPAGIVRPRFPTTQGDGWGDILPDLCACLLANPRMLVWCEPFLSATVVRMLRAVRRLEADGFYDPRAPAADAVVRWQRAYNAAHPGSAMPLLEDNRCGPATLAAMGL